MTADRIINFVLCSIGALIFYALWRYDVLSASLIWKILSAEI
jgi:hypothetical protein